jgi:hypothetical protein
MIQPQAAIHPLKKNKMEQQQVENHRSQKQKSLGWFGMSASCVRPQPDSPRIILVRPEDMV